MNADREQAAIRYLEQEYLWHVDMLEALRRGRGEVVYFKGKTVLIRRNEGPGIYLLTTDDLKEAEAAFAGQPAPRDVVARGPGVAEWIGKRFHLTLSEYCCNVAYLKQYPLASVKLVDDFGQPGDDGNSMRANNTSAFCYRQVTGSNHLSWHSFGAAIDINPLQNPYVNKGRVSPEEAREYLDRKDKRPHMIDHGDDCYKIFIAHGWKWGGDWSGDKDYQHFYKELSGVKR